MKNVRKNLGTITFFSDGASMTRIVFTNERILSSAHFRPSIHSEGRVLPDNSVQAEQISENCPRILRGLKNQKCERFKREESIQFFVLLFAIASRDSGRADGILRAPSVSSRCWGFTRYRPRIERSDTSLEFSARSTGAPHGAWIRLVERFVPMSYSTELLFP